jgi:hypothetical protein
MEQKSDIKNIRIWIGLLVTILIGSFSAWVTYAIATENKSPYALVYALIMFTVTILLIDPLVRGRFGPYNR